MPIPGGVKGRCGQDTQCCGLVTRTPLESFFNLNNSIILNPFAVPSLFLNNVIYFWNIYFIKSIPIFLHHFLAFNKSYRVKTPLSSSQNWSYFRVFCLLKSSGLEEEQWLQKPLRFQGNESTIWAVFSDKAGKWLKIIWTRNV